MASEKEISSLIQRLKDSTSLQDQLMTLVRAWRTIRGLTPAQRAQVAVHVGLDEAESLLQRLGRPAGIAPARLLRAVRKAEKARPGELSEILSDLKDPSKRAAAAGRGLDVVSDLVEAASGDQKRTPVEVPAAPPARATSGAEEKLEAIRKIGELKIPKPPPKIQPVAPKKDTESAPPESAAERAAEPEPIQPETRVEPVPETQPTAPAQPPKQGDRVSAFGREVKWPGPTSIVEPAPVSPQAADEGLVADLRKQTSLIRRFNRLRKALDSEETVGDPLEVLGTFPAGWARRRALQALIRAGRIDGTRITEALQSLENPRDEQWCVSTLLRNQILSQTQFEQLSATLRNPRSRRLLEQHFHTYRAGS